MLFEVQFDLQCSFNNVSTNISITINPTKPSKVKIVKIKYKITQHSKGISFIYKEDLTREIHIIRDRRGRFICFIFSFGHFWVLWFPHTLGVLQNFAYLGA